MLNSDSNFNNYWLQFRFSLTCRIEIIAGIEFFLLIYVIFRIPDESKLHNFGQIVNLTMVIFFLGWMIAR